MQRKVSKDGYFDEDLENFALPIENSDDNEHFL